MKTGIVMVACWMLALCSAGDAGELCPQFNIGADCYFSTSAHAFGYNTDPEAEVCATNATACSGFTEMTISISASSTNATMNSGPLEPGEDLFVWLLCTGFVHGMSYGFTLADYPVVTDMPVQSYEPIVGTGSWSRSANPFLLSIYLGECPTVVPTLLGRLRIGTPTSVDAGARTETWGRVKSLYK